MAKKPAAAAHSRPGEALKRSPQVVDRVLDATPDLALTFLLLLPLLLALALVPGLDILPSVVLSVAGFAGAYWLIPLAAAKLAPKLNGVDLGKVPSLGLVSGTAFLVVLILTQLLHPNSKAKYDSIMLSVCFSVLLGLADDVMDIRWAHKLVMGVLASLPLIAGYDGPTSIILPSPVRFLVASQSPLHAVLPWVRVFPSEDGTVLELGVLYSVYILGLIVFCTNAINILAGINGIETGQTLVAAVFVAVMDALELASSPPDSANYQNHYFSLTVMLPFIFTTLALTSHNWFPARVFVGDVFPYYAGMTFAATAVLGHYSRSLLLLLIPQVLNFLYSAPQLFGLVPIPRHRLPAVNEKTLLLEPSRVAPGDPRANMTLLCLVLQVFGAMRERSLTICVLLLQALCCAAGLYSRGFIAQTLFK
jgi:UDP-N-acetylglucosamine--dolichyl-phosphate N-acetylglucosaminephosphotransferase